MVAIACRNRVKMSRMLRIVSNGEAQEFTTVAEFAHHRFQAADPKRRNSSKQPSSCVPT